VYEVTREVALQTIAGPELDFAINTLIGVDPPIQDAHRKKKIVYRISSEDSPEQSFVSGGTQQIKRLSDNAIELTVIAKSLPPVNSRVVTTDAKYLNATRFLQSRDSLVIEHADRAAAGETDPSRVAGRMEKYVLDKIKQKNFSTAMASAAEVAQKMEGDCTEHAVLLAAMLRAKKIPSRIAAGLVYVESLNSFGGHMWTEAFLAGEWIPLDATLGRGGIGAAHLKMSESAMDEDSPLPVMTFLPLYNIQGKLKIEAQKGE
jgi:transglutaminase-like putative cysteine protease